MLRSLGGDDRVTIGITIGNDTGSNVLSLFSTDLDTLGCNYQTYNGIMGDIAVATANGVCTRARIMVEMQLLRADHSPFTSWFVELAVVILTVLGQNQMRLSGNGMRQILFFATSPGNACDIVCRREEVWHNFPTSSNLTRFISP